MGKKCISIVVPMYNEQESLQILYRELNRVTREIGDYDFEYLFVNDGSKDATLQKIRELAPDVLVVVAFGQIIPQEILDIAPYGCINVHGSLLPKYRGAAPIQWAVIDGEKESGVTTMQMDAGLDTGDMLLKTVVPLDEKETGGSLFDKLSKAGADLLLKTLDALENGTVTPQKQGESPTAYAKMLDKKLGNIDWTKSAAEIERLVRGLNSWPSAYTYWNKKVVKIWKASVTDENSNEQVGTVVKVEKDSFYVQTGNGLLKVLELQIPGKKRMDAGAFLRGYTIEPGEVFHQE